MSPYAELSPFAELSLLLPAELARDEAVTARRVASSENVLTRRSRCEAGE